MAEHEGIIVRVLFPRDAPASGAENLAFRHLPRAGDILSVMLRDERSFNIWRVKHVVHHVYHDDSRPAPVTIEVEEIEPGEYEGMRLELS